MRSVAALMQDAESEAQCHRWRRHFEDFVRFSLALCSLDGTAFLASSRHRQATRRGYRKFLRRDAELRRLAGDRLLGEPRFKDREAHTSELQSLMRISYAVFCMTKKKT